VLFDDTGALLPDGQSLPPHRLVATPAPRLHAHAVRIRGRVTALAAS
jgi:hypothetical protein